MKAFFRISLLFLIILSSCRRQDNFFEGSAKLRFSVDTLVFDTVFTTVGSVTKRFKVYNDYDQDLEIEQISLAGSNNSPYRLNIDGMDSNTATDVLLRAKDSLHIFVETTIDPNNSNNPLIHTDSVTFLTNGRLQDVDLVAWGQDAHFYYNNSFVEFDNGDPDVPNDTLFYYSISEPTVWGNDKPHVIYGNVIVHDGGTLDVEAGANVHLHHNSNILIAEGSSLKMMGELSAPILVASDRLDDFYSDLSGQWGRIWLMGGSMDNHIQYTTIKNGTIGLQVDTVSSTFEPTLRLENSIIANNATYGLYAYSSRIEAFNCQITDNGAHDIFLFAGGDYRFSHCTLANYGSSHSAPSLRMSNFYEDVDGNTQLRPMDRADFENCIIYGTMQSELVLEEDEQASFNYKFNSCLMRLKESDFDLSNTNHFDNIITNESPEFIQTMSAYEYDYQLDTLSPAQNAAATNIALQFPYDILGNSRLSDQGPDMGAYERIE